MGRWEPDAQGRLRRAALELFAEHGFEQTTVAGIADRAGVTERTFFRYFSDKREVLFDATAGLEHLVIEHVVAAPEAAALDIVGDAMIATGELLADREYSRSRAAVIAANPSLQERELLKLAALSTATAAALRERGVAELPAALAADAGVSVFRIGFERWIAGNGDRDDRGLSAYIAAAFAELKSLV